jgi:hypothetical protein
MTKGPLAVRWLDWSLEPVHAGTTTVLHAELENTGSVTWSEEMRLSYHWLDLLENPIVWDGIRTPLWVVEPGGRTTVEARVRAPIPPGSYRFAPDIVVEARAWFSALGSGWPSREVEVLPRPGNSRVDLPAWVEPAPDWQERVAAAHADGYGVVAGSIDWKAGLGRRRPTELAPYATGTGRIAAFEAPLLCPSVLEGIELRQVGEVAGLPAFAPPEEEPWLYDGRIVLHAHRGRR